MYLRMKTQALKQIKEMIHRTKCSFLASKKQIYTLEIMIKKLVSRQIMRETRVRIQAVPIILAGGG